jgi:hypothetical protein
LLMRRYAVIKFKISWVKNKNRRVFLKFIEERKRLVQSKVTDDVLVVADAPSKDNISMEWNWCNGKIENLPWKPVPEWQQLPMEWFLTVWWPSSWNECLSASRLLGWGHCGRSEKLEILDGDWSAAHFYSLLVLDHQSVEIKK